MHGSPKACAMWVMRCKTSVIKSGFYSSSEGVVSRFADPLTAPSVLLHFVEICERRRRSVARLETSPPSRSQALIGVHTADEEIVDLCRVVVMEALLCALEDVLGHLRELPCHSLAVPIIDHLNIFLFMLLGESL